MGISVREITADDFLNWDAYVRNHPDGTFCHLSGWKTVVEQGAGQRCPYLVAEHDGGIVALLPLTFRKSILFGNAFVSSMFAVYGGVIASSKEAQTAIEQHAWKLVRSAKLGVLTYRSPKANHHDEKGWSVDGNSAATFQKAIKLDAEAILLDIPRKQRAVVRKSLKNGLSCRWNEDVNAFYRLYAMSVRNLGTPVFPKKLFIKFLEIFGDDVEVQVVYCPEGRPIASLMSFYFKDYVLPYYAGGTVEARKYAAHDYMYYQLMVRAAKKGKKIFDFGRSKVGTGPYKFKKNWGFEPTPLEYQHQLEEGCQPPDLNPNNKKYELLVKVWKKLPLGIANILGPTISRHLG